MNHIHSYKRLGLMAALSFVSMYVLMYAMVNSLSNVFSNFNQFYMAGLMASPMVIIEVLLMGGMYINKKLNLYIIFGSIALLILFWAGIRQQFAIGDEQFLKSMIPHHAGAILMCQQAKLVDPQVKELCRGIITGQQVEIDLMKTKLESLK